MTLQSKRDKVVDPAGADPNTATRAGGATPLHRACYMGHIAVSEAL